MRQLAALQKFRSALENQGLLGEYDSAPDLAYKVRSAIEGDLMEMGLSVPAARQQVAEHARPRAQRHGDSLLLQNRSTTVAAEQLRFEIAGVWPASWGVIDEGNDPVHLMYDGEQFDLLPDSHMEWSMLVFGQSPPQLKVTMYWFENGEPCTEIQIISL